MSANKRFHATAIAVTLALPLWAADLRGPIAGYVFDSASGLIRPINGLPGAALAGDALEARTGPAGPSGSVLRGSSKAPARFSWVRFAPGQGSAVALSREGQLYWLQFEASRIQAHPLEGTADLVAFDSTGLKAVLYTAASRQYRVFESGAAGEAMTLPELRGALRAIAIDATGKTLALAVETSGADAVFTLDTGTDSLQFVAQALAVSSLRLSADGNELLFADRAASQVMTARRVNGEWTVSVAADGREGLNAPMAAEWTTGGALVILNSGSNELLVKANGNVELLSIPAGTLRLDPMASPGLLHLAAPRGIEPGVPLYLLEARQQEGAPRSRVLFVPTGGPAQ